METVKLTKQTDNQSGFTQHILLMHMKSQDQTGCRNSTTQKTRVIHQLKKMDSSPISDIRLKLLNFRALIVWNLMDQCKIKQHWSGRKASHYFATTLIVLNRSEEVFARLRSTSGLGQRIGHMWGERLAPPAAGAQRGLISASCKMWKGAGDRKST